MIILFIIAQLTQCVSFIGSSEIYDLTISGDNIWCGTNGGIAVFNKQTAQFICMTVSDGLFSSFVIQAKQDKYGNIWCCCKDGGIVVYGADRSIKKKFTFREGLPSYDFSSTVIKGDTVLIGSVDGAKLWLYDMNGGSLDTGKWYVEDVLPSNEINEIKLSGDSIWFATNNGIGVTTDFSNFVTYDTGNKLLDDTVLSVGIWGNYVWAGTKKGVANMKLGDSVWNIIDTNLIMYNFCSTDTALWGAGDQGTYRWTGLPDNGAWQQISGTRSRVLTLESTLWIGSLGNGLLKYVSGNSQSYIPDGPPLNWFNTIAVDLNGSLWNTHRYNKAIPAYVISKLYEEGQTWKWKTYNSGKEWGGQEVRKILVDSKNNKWVFMWNGDPKKPAIVKVFPNDSTKTIIFPEGGICNVVTGCYIDKNDNAWVGCADGYIRRVNGDADTVDTIVSNNYTTDIYALSLDSLDNLWVGGGGNHPTGVTILAKDGSIRVVDGLPVGAIYFINMGINGEMWIGMDKGLYQIEEEKTVQIFSIPTLGGTPIDAHIDSSRVWLAIQDVGISVLEKGEFTSYGKVDGIVSNAVSAIDFDPINKVVWTGTENGLSKCSLVGELPPYQSKIKVYPNPFVLSRGHQTIKFSAPAIQVTKVNIYTLSGKLINNKGMENDTTWNPVTDKASTGIYLFIIYEENGKKESGKFAIIM